MFSSTTVEKELDTDIITSPEMSVSVDLWSKMYQGVPPWLSGTVKGFNLSSSIAAEIARLVTLEMESNVVNNTYLDEQYQVVIDDIRRYTEYACAKGGIVFKPYANGENIEVDITQADYFFPTATNSRGEITGAVFLDTKSVGDYVYTRLEEHSLVGTTYTIKNRAFLNTNAEYSDNLGKEIPLTDVEEWAELAPEVTIQNIKKPLFAYFKMPFANTIDTGSPLGVSVYSRAVGDLEELDKQYSRILWEYEGSELAVDASIDCFKLDVYGNPILPQGKERLFRSLFFSSDTEKDSIKTFSPDIRDVSLFNGLDKLLRQIEFKCGLAYGTLSDPQNVDKTAEEIKTSKQRSYQTIKDTQKSLEKALKHLVYCMEVVGNLSGLPTGLNNEVTFEWDDSILVDEATERQQDRQDVAMGVMSLIEYRVKWYSETKEEAAKNIPQQADTIQ
ncbi:phage portal protein [Anaerosacchariphilus polymeriproducens]|uniref:phage portal protein n=1 Tax=Anaerosacchariphilus polymeriproducens TaxID=1812858 RepID=UPI001F3A2235|nr:phage portal protein [Anaerosacchariphilus polymeriproducens]